MNRLELVTHVLAHLRSHNHFPLARAAVAAACAQSGATGATRGEIAERLGVGSATIGSTLDRMTEAGVVRRVGSVSPARHVATAAGLDLIAPLLQTSGERRAAVVAAVKCSTPAKA